MFVGLDLRPGLLAAIHDGREGWLELAIVEANELVSKRIYTKLGTP